MAYFCAEFGVHESLPIYSGGLGILAGDHCKAASDFQLPFVAVGLLYRQGYFVQTIDGDGRQRAEYHDSDFDDLPIEPVQRQDGAELTVELALPGAQAVRARSGRRASATCALYLLDTDLPENAERDRDIAHRLYGGDRTTRLEQEIVLGVGGVRALAALGLKPTVWHINEGHAAFLVLERVRALVAEGLALEAAHRGGGVEHGLHHAHAGAGGPRPVHRRHRGAVPAKRCSASSARRTRSPRSRRPPAGGDFNMTALAIRGSRYHNGVSRIHGGVSQRPAEGFLAAGHARGKPGRLRHQRRARRRPSSRPNGARCSTASSASAGCTASAIPASGKRSATSPTTSSGACARTSRRACCTWCATASRSQHARNHGSESHLERLLRYADPANPNVLTIGFGRRFATYKRATLLFNDLDSLRRIVGRPRAAGAVPLRRQGAPGRRAGPGADPHASCTCRRQAEFEGRLLFLEGYDLHLARRLVSGVDVWLNNPVHPLEASGTSGMKAGMNGVHQPLDPRRLVGRGLRRRERLGDQAGLARSSTRTGATARRRARSTRSCRTT